MKKFKLITSLSTLGILSTSVPLVATACKNDNKEVVDTTNYYVANGQKIVIDDALNQGDINLLADTGSEQTTVVINGETIQKTELSEVHVGHSENILSIPAKFLNNCPNLTKVDLTGIKDILYIADDFLLGCSNLSSLKLPSLKSLTLEQHVQMLSENNKEQLPEGFLKGSSLSSLDLKPLANMRIIPSYFLSLCTNLKTVDLSSFNQVFAIKYGFLGGCTSLEDVKLPKMIESEYAGKKSKPFIQAVGAFLSCGLLKSIDFSQWTSVNFDVMSGITGNFPEAFLTYCIRLEKVNFGSISNKQFGYYIADPFDGSEFQYLEDSKQVDVDINWSFAVKASELKQNKGEDTIYIRDTLTEYKGIQFSGSHAKNIAGFFENNEFDPDADVYRHITVAK